MTRWEALSAERQTEVRIEYGRSLDPVPPPGSLEEKILRLDCWLAQGQIVRAPSP